MGLGPIRPLASVRNMYGLNEVLSRRRKELTGRPAKGDDISRLRQMLFGTPFMTLSDVYCAFPVSGMVVQFTVDNDKIGKSPDTDFMCKYDSARDHEFYWMTPNQVAEEVEQAIAGPYFLANGFLPIGMCAMGGDGYFLGSSVDKPDILSLLRVYYDCIDPEQGTHIPPNAIDCIATSFVQILSVARFERGFEPIQ